MDENPEIVQGLQMRFIRQLWYESHQRRNCRFNYFLLPGTDRDIIISVVENYKEIDALAKTFLKEI